MADAPAGKKSMFNLTIIVSVLVALVGYDLLLKGAVEKQVAKMKAKENLDDEL
jgi:hypothetical protein